MSTNTKFPRHLLHEEYTYKGRPVILDASELAPGEFEVMLMSKDGSEIQCQRVRNEIDARGAFRFLRRTYRPDAEPVILTGKYAKLRDDLRQALEAGQAAEAANPEDGGTCNFDAASLALPRWRQDLVKQAAKEAGTSCCTWELFGQRRYVFNPNTRGHGNARSRNAEAMTAALRRMGYDTFEYCQMD